MMIGTNFLNFRVFLFYKETRKRRRIQRFIKAHNPFGVVFSFWEVIALMNWESEPCPYRAMRLRSTRSPSRVMLSRCFVSDSDGRMEYTRLCGDFLSVFGYGRENQRLATKRGNLISGRAGYSITKQLF